MVLEMSKGPTGGEISDISEALLDHLVKIAYPVGMLLRTVQWIREYAGAPIFLVSGNLGLSDR